MIPNATYNQKYPRTPHCPWSEKASGDDLWLDEQAFMSCFGGREVVITEKLDGECTTLTREKCYARSPDAPTHSSRDLLKQIWATLRWAIPEGWAMIGENLFAKHAIYYDKLPPRFPATSSPLFVFAVVDSNNTMLGWSEVLDFLAEMPLDMQVVPILWRGQIASSYETAKNDIKNTCWKERSAFGDRQEGYVIRNTEAFPVCAFSENVCKFVAKDFSPGNEHWQTGRYIRNAYCEE